MGISIIRLDTLTATSGTGKPVSIDTDYGRSRELAAEKFNESPATVARAVQVVKEGAPELVAEVERGDVSVSAAADVATLPKPQQPAMRLNARQRRSRVETGAQTNTVRGKSQKMRLASLPNASPRPPPPQSDLRGTAS